MQRREGQFVGQFNDSRTVLYHGVIQGSSGGTHIIMVQWKLNEQKRQHRERAQPANRQKLGLLEKHADYVKRARDYHSKEDRLTKLKEKAAGRNKDEFYFGMINSKTVKGIHVQSRGNEAMPQDLVKVLKTQDAGYIRTQRAMEESRVRRLEQQLNAALPINVPRAAGQGGDDDDDDMMLDDWDAFDEPPPVASTSASSSAGSNAKQHIVFTDDLNLVRHASDASKVLKRTRSKAPTLTTASGTSTSNSKKGKGKAKAQAQAAAQEEAQLQAAAEAQRVEEANKHREALTQELEARQGRLQALNRAMRELETQRILMGGRGGAAKEVVQRTKYAEKDRELPIDQLDDGVKRQRGGDSGGGRGGKVLPEAEVGLSSGARVWKWKTQRKR